MGQRPINPISFPWNSSALYKISHLEIVILGGGGAFPVLGDAEVEQDSRDGLFRRGPNSLGEGGSSGRGS